MAGLINVGRQYKTQAMQGMQQSAELEKEREMVEDNQDAQRKQGQMMGAGTGAAIGMQVGGPWGAAIGAGVGLLASSLF